MPFTRENAKEMAQLSAQVRLESAEQRAELANDERARQVLAASAEALAKELVNAALGRGGYAGELKASERLHAVIKALEWGIGRPRPAIQQEETSKAGEIPGLIVE